MFCHCFEHPDTKLTHSNYLQYGKFSMDAWVSAFYYNMSDHRLSTCSQCVCVCVSNSTVLV